MEGRITYECKKCNAILSKEDDGKAPECCGMPMEKLPKCTTTDTAEHARANDEGEPCDDSRAG